MSARSALAAATAALAATGCATPAAEPAAATPAGSFPAAAWNAACTSHDEWDEPGPPFRIFGDTYYVGTCGISAILIAGEEGHVLIDGATEAGGKIIADNVAQLGFDIADVKLLLLTHEHFDHAGGLAQLRQTSGAQMLALPEQAAVLATGRPDRDDPQAASLPPFAPVPAARTLRDGEVIRLGDIAVTAHATPGHTAGATSYTWRACEAGECRQVAYLDSLSPVSAEGYRFVDHPDLVARFRASYARVAALPCDIALAPHPTAIDLPERIASPDGLQDAGGCAAYAATMRRRLDERLAAEGAGR